MDSSSQENLGKHYVPQQDIVHLELTVQEAVTFSAALRLPRGTSVATLDSWVANTIQRLGLEHRASVKIGSLAGGQKKRVSIAAEVLSRPPILFLDEPSSGLDPSTEFKLMELLPSLHYNETVSPKCNTAASECLLFDHRGHG